ncbi:hypothetical protein NPIL_489371, partial [Nephila pilipes]
QLKRKTSSAPLTEDE